MTDWLIRNRTGVFWGAVVLTLALIAGLSQIRIDFRFDGFFPKDDEEYHYYEEYQSLFYEAQNYLVAIALESPEEDIFDRDFLELADSTFRKIAALKGIDSVALGTQFEQLKRRGLGYSSRPFLEWETEKQLEQSKKRILKDSLFIGSFAGKNLKHICGFFYLEPDLFDSPERDVVNRTIKRYVKETKLENYVSGIPYIRTQYIDKLGSELLLFLSMSAFLLLSALVALYRTPWGVMVPLMTAFAALGCTMGLMGITGEPLSILSSLLIPIMFVVSMSDVIHLMTKYLSIAREGVGKIEALRLTLSRIGLATFLTSLTTAIGFGSLTISRIGPIRAFGLYAALGVLVTFVVAVAILSFAMPRLRPDQFAREDAFANSPFWNRNLSRLNTYIQSNPRKIALAMVFLVISSILLTSRIPFDNYLIQDMGENDPAKVAMRFFEEEMYGMRSFELGIHAAEGYRVSDKEVLDEMAKIEAYLQQQAYFSPFFSPSSFIQEANYLYHFNRDKHRKIPDEQEDIDELFNFASLNGGDPILLQLMNEDRSRARMHARIPDIGTDAFRTMHDSLELFIQSNCDSTVFTHHMTGHAFLTERNLIYLRDSLMFGLLIAFILVGGIMGLLFKSWKMLFVSMLPNVIPLILTGGVMGLFGIPLSSSTAIVFVISFGIAVDDTIHFLTRYRLERQRGKGVDEAISATLLGTGKAMILTSIVLLGGFALLLFSSFGGTFNTGFFTALTIVFALLADLIFLPVLLRWVKA